MHGVQTVAIDSLEDPRVAAFRDLRDAFARDRDGLFIVEGRDNVRQLLAQQRLRVRSLLVTPTALVAVREAIRVHARPFAVYVASLDLLKEVVGYDLHRGCVALGERPLDPGVEAFCAGGELLVALEHVSNPDNVGGIFRNARAFGASGVLLCATSGDPLYRKSIRVSMGGSLHVPFARAVDLVAALDRLADAGHAIVGLDPGSESVEIGQEPDRFRKAGRPVLVLGSEGDGLSERTRARCHLRVRIPMAAGVDSLNVSTASGIALHHFAGGLR